MTLKRHLTILFAVVISAGALSSFVFVRVSTERLFRSYVYSGDAAKAGLYIDALADFFGRDNFWEQAVAYIESLDDRVVLADASGIVVADTSGDLLGTAHPARHLAHGAALVRDGERLGTVMVGSMIDSSLRGTAERYSLYLSLSLLASTVLAFLIAFFLALFFSARIAKPLGSLNRAVGLIVAGDYTVSVPEAGDDDFRYLCRSFNAMSRQLARLEAAKQRVIADAAHELRTPVTLIRGTIEAMLDGVFPLETAALEPVLRETLRLSRLIDTMRELELIESGNMRLERARLDLSETAGRSAALFGPAAHEKNITLTVEPAEDGSFPVWADPLRIDEVLYNLLSNALRFAGGGGTVRIGLRRGAGLVCLTVEDSGPGIAEADKERIFDRFFRVDASRSTDLGGRGLGLAIVREIVLAHGGTVAAGASGLGGAAFTVELPVYAGQGAGPEAR